MFVGRCGAGGECAIRWLDARALIQLCVDGRIRDKRRKSVLSSPVRYRPSGFTTESVASRTGQLSTIRTFFYPSTSPAPVLIQVCHPTAVLCRSRLLAHCTPQRPPRSSRYHLRHRLRLLCCMHLARRHQLLGTSLCRPFRSRTRNRAQICDGSYICRRMCSSRHPRCAGNDVVRRTSFNYRIVFF